MPARSQHEARTVSGTGIKRRRLGEQAWREILTRFEASGLGTTAFCKREGVCFGSLQRWRERLANLPAPIVTAGPMPPGEAPGPAVVLTSSPPSKPPSPTPPKFIELGTLGQASSG